MFQNSTKTVKLIVKFKGRELIFPPGFDLNSLRKEEFHAELTIEQYAFENQAAFEFLREEKKMRLIGAGSRLLINISLKLPLADRKLRDAILKEEIPLPPADGGFVEVFLDEDLDIIMRGNKKAKLDNCDILVPALEERAESLNHAYTLISEKFEPWRRSHTANVFQKAFWFDEKLGRWIELDRLRQRAEAGKMASG